MTRRTAAAAMALASHSLLVCTSAVRAAHLADLIDHQTAVLRAIPAPPNVDRPPTEAKKTSSGLATLVLQRGTGKDRPAANDSVLVHFTGWTSDGTMFDSSVARGRPERVFVDRIIPGLAEALQLMVEGEQRRVWVPADRAFVLGGPPGPKGALVVDLELIDIPSLALRKAPPSLGEPRDVHQTPSGLAYTVLRAGVGTQHPGDDSVVTFDAVGWNADREWFISSPRRAPITVTMRQLARTIPGCAELVKLLVEGEKARLWIPESDGYTGLGVVKGPLVMDVLLLRIAAANPASGSTDASSTTPDGAVRPGGSVTLPVPIQQPRPSYTPDAMRAKIQGVVLLECIVQADGTVGAVRVVRSLDPILGLDDTAIDAARRWRFRPGTRGGDPVSVYVTIELTFTLR
jgi:peptidylprolyl isomerase